jgi:hypothetical protein
MAIPKPFVKVWDSTIGRDNSGTGSGRGGDLRNLSCEHKGMGCKKEREDRNKKNKYKYFLFGVGLILFRF